MLLVVRRNGEEESSTGRAESKIDASTGFFPVAIARRIRPVATADFFRADRLLGRLRGIMAAAVFSRLCWLGFGRFGRIAISGFIHGDSMPDEDLCCMSCRTAVAFRYITRS